MALAMWFSHTDKPLCLTVSTGRYNIFCIDKTSGSIRSVAKKTAINGSYTLTESKAEQVYWIEKI